MIVAASLNPSIDRTVEVERLHVGGLNRILSQTDVAAGKGVNVALAAAALGEEALCAGLMYEDGAQLFEARLSAAGVGREFVRCAGAVRVNTKVFDRARGEITELNASGAPVAAEQLREAEELLTRRARECEYLALTGSLPPGCPAGLYRTLAAGAREAGCRVVLDADGERLRLGLEARPFLIKPNRYELELLIGRKLNGMDEILAAARACVRLGARYVAVSLGAEGALITDGRAALRTPGSKVEVRSTVGAGDSMIAGLAAGFARGLDMEGALRLGVGAATARCAIAPECGIDAALAERCAGELTMERIDG